MLVTLPSVVGAAGFFERTAAAFGIEARAAELSQRLETKLDSPQGDQKRSAEYARRSLSADPIRARQKTLMSSDLSSSSLPS